MNEHDEKLKAAADRLRLGASDVDSLLDAVLRLGQLVHKFSQVQRGVPLDRSGTPESDTDHTVLLSLVACCVAAKLAPDLQLDLGKVAHYALVHDLVEAYSGDTNTMEYDRLDLEERRKREEKAQAEFMRAHSAFPWLIETLNNYESLADREARFVKALDKAMPAIIHNLNDGLIFEKDRPAFEPPVELQDSVRGRDPWLRKNDWARDQELALSIRELLMERVLIRQWEKYGQTG